MDAKRLPARPSLEQYKKQAKELVKVFRAEQSHKSSESTAIQRVKTWHPRFADLPADKISSTKFALADAQFVIAREHGFESWPKFARHVEALGSASFAASVSDPVTAFIEAACVPRDSGHSSGTLERAEAILAAHPEVASNNIYAAAILGDVVGVRRFLAIDARNATAKGGPYGWDALTYLCFSRYLRLDRARSNGFLAAAKALLDAGASANTGWMERNHEPHPEWESAIYGAAGIAQHPGVTRLLLERGADPKILSRDNESMLSAAAGLAFIHGYHRGKSPEERLQVVKLFVQLGNDVNWPDDYGITPLMAAANYGNVPIIQYLIDAGADLSAHDLGKKNDGQFGSSNEPLMPVDYAIGVGTFVPNNAVIIHEDAVALMAKVMKERGIVHTTSECTLRGFSCSQAKVDPKVATPAEILRARKLAVGHQIEGLTGGLEAK